ncbi:serine/threonine-protein kinase [Rarobacter faecitabidus]|uniref:non-specific serine/threonine protein kinase n=1 Tax=Rarobacter faecitabidus TaxID=13243 RepID=A0A542ZPL6_RARFA|nr:serine/threonine-protein kinase [Rarobacter faecitabidus]TQL62179.1 serine/threonine-protein kinase [Rarobacter faecitabidus]
MAIVPVPGLILGERYRLVRQLAVGGMGQVWVAQDTSLSREVAIKVLKPEFAGNADFLRRLRTEARNAASLSHSGIAQLFDYGERDGIGYLVLELVLGEPMSDLLERSPVLPLDRALDILSQTARALHSAHISGVVHRDVKPGNILLDRQGIVKITDFGVSLAADQAPMTATGMVMGTAQYLSPEQAVGRPATPSSDIYALGVIGFEALVGHRPFTGKTAVDIAVAHVNEPVPALPASVPPDVASLIGRMLAKDPSVRPRSGAQLAIMLDELSAKYQSSPWLGAIGSTSGPQPRVPSAAPLDPRAEPRRRSNASNSQPRRTPVQGTPVGRAQAGAAARRAEPAEQRGSAGNAPVQSPALGQGARHDASAGGAATPRARSQASGSSREASSPPPLRRGAPRGSDPDLTTRTPRQGSSRARAGQRPEGPERAAAAKHTSTTTGQRWGRISWQAIVLGMLILAALIGSIIGVVNSGRNTAAGQGMKMGISAVRTDEGTTVRQQYRVTVAPRPTLPVADGARALAIPTTVKDI